jgi:UTP-glucose-1-phosphate uridylyltransferase
LNNSKCDLSQSYANKSQLFREIKEESVIKINQIVEKMTKSVVFGNYWFTQTVFLYLDSGKKGGKPGLHLTCINMLIK